MDTKWNMDIEANRLHRERVYHPALTLKTSLMRLPTPFDMGQKAGIIRQVQVQPPNMSAWNDNQ